MLSGVEKRLLIKKKTRCGECEGSRCLRGTVPTRCWTCHGRGATVFKNGPYLEEEPCKKCQGHGMTIKHACPQCNGKGLVLCESLDVFRIPALVEEGRVLEYEHRGHAAANSYAGTLFLTVKVDKHATFQRQNLNIVSDVSLSYALGILGGTIQVETLQGLKEVVIEPYFGHNNQLVIQGGGLTCPKSGKTGNHTLRFFFKSPAMLTEEEERLYWKLSAPDE